MKNLIAFTISIFLAAGAFSQNPASPDTLLKKNVSISGDTLIKVEVPVAAQAAQPATTKTKTRKDTRPIMDRIDIDFNTSFWANTNQVFGEFMLTIAYRFPKILSIGTGPLYLFNYQRAYDKNLNGFGGKVFVRADFLKFIYATTEYQGIDNQYITIDNQASKGYTTHYNYVDSWFVGAGVNIRLGRRNSINMSVNYDILYDKNYSPYYNAVVYRVGYGF